MKNALLTLSLIANIGLVVYFFIRPKMSGLGLAMNAIDKNDNIPDYEITSMRNFKAVYFNRNDSIYKNLWGEAFENEPEQAFLIACSYYYLEKDTAILKDINVSIEQLEHAYNRRITIGYDSLQ